MYRFAVHDPALLPHSGCRVDVFVESGELVALVGDNGVGKTTLLQRIFRDNRETVGLVPQAGLDFFFDRTLGTLRKLYKNAEVNRARLDLTWEAFNLHRKENRYLSDLSGGEAQALKLCLVLAVEKSVYLLDEPHQHLDPVARGYVLELIRELTKEGRGIVLVEHNLDLVPRPATVIQLLQRDNVLIAGDTWTI
jgi:ABC-type multidrug transport system ATPase subunit